jgi:hypothetical protein
MSRPKTGTTRVTYNGVEFIKTVSPYGTGYVPVSMPMEAMIGMRDSLLKILARESNRKKGRGEK